MRPLSSKVFCLFFFCLLLAAEITPAWAQGGNSGIVGHWRYKDKDWDVQVDFNSDGTFSGFVEGKNVYQEGEGSYSLRGGTLFAQTPQGLSGQIGCRVNGNSITLIAPNGKSVHATRTGKTPQQKRQPTLPSQLYALLSPLIASAVAPTSMTLATDAPTSPTIIPHPPRILLHRQTEPGESAFTLLVPDGWKTEGGMVNLASLKNSWPGNSSSPKCDFTVKNDDQGTVMLRWMPSWNYADLSAASSSKSAQYPVGSTYQGMPVRAWTPAEHFLTELFKKERPHAENLKVVARDFLKEATEALETRYTEKNATLRDSGLPAIAINSLALLVEYDEEGVRYRECLTTTLDYNASACKWSHAGTLFFRAPAGTFEEWKSVLDIVRRSRRDNPQWLESVEKSANRQERITLETQNHIRQTVDSVLEQRDKKRPAGEHAEWMFPTGKGLYLNPFNGGLEPGSSVFAYYWLTNKGDVLYTDDEKEAPGERDPRGDVQWKRLQPLP